MTEGTTWGDVSKAYFASLKGGHETVTRLQTPLFFPAFIPLIIEILTSHGATVEVRASSCEIHFPEGTTKTEVFPRTHAEKYCILFPDQFTLHETKMRGRDYSYVEFERALLSPSQQATLKNILSEQEHC